MSRPPKCAIMTRCSCLTCRLKTVIAIKGASPDHSSPQPSTSHAPPTATSFPRAPYDSMSIWHSSTADQISKSRHLHTPPDDSFDETHYRSASARPQHLAKRRVTQTQQTHGWNAPWVDTLTSPAADWDPKDLSGLGLHFGPVGAIGQ